MVVESFRPGVVSRLGIGYDDVKAVNADSRVLLDVGLRPRRPPPAVGRTRSQLPGGGRLSGVHAAPLPTGVRPSRAPRWPTQRRAGCTPRWPSAPRCWPATVTGEGTYLDVSVADGVLWLMSLTVDEHLATGAEPGPGHDVLTGRYACYGTYATADGRWLAVAAIETKFFANLCRALGLEHWAERQYDDGAQDDLRAALAGAFATRGRDDWVAELAGADTCVAPVQEVSEIPHDAQFAARRALVQARRPDGELFGQVGAVMAGMAKEPSPGAGSHSRRRGDRHRRAVGGGRRRRRADRVGSVAKGVAA